jgi:hypothetical protein
MPRHNVGRVVAIGSDGLGCGPCPFHHDPAKSSQKGVDVHRPSLLCSAIDFNRDSLPTSLAASSIENHFHVSVTRKTLPHRLVHPQITTRNDE